MEINQELDAHVTSPNGSISHSIIAQFIAELRKKEGLSEIAAALEQIIYTRPAESKVRAALFGDEAI